MKASLIPAFGPVEEVEQDGLGDLRRLIDGRDALLRQEVLWVKVFDDPVQKLALKRPWFLRQVTGDPASYPLLVLVAQIDPFGLFGIFERLLSLRLRAGRGLIDTRDLVPKEVGILIATGFAMHHYDDYRPVGDVA